MCLFLAVNYLDSYSGIYDFLSNGSLASNLSLSALFVLSIGLGFIVEKETDWLPPLGLFFGYFVVLSSFRFVYECLGSIL